MMHLKANQKSSLKSVELYTQMATDLRKSEDKVVLRLVD
jgi:hypothetical protein